MNWISISECEPPLNTFIIVTDGMTTGITHSDNLSQPSCEFIDMYTDDSMYVISPRIVTHWMYVSDVKLPACNKCDTICIECQMIDVDEEG